jgi:uncharacterized protein (UPF0335 family)
MTEAAKTNGFDPDLTSNLVNRIENLHKQMDTLKAEHMNLCKAVREDIKVVYKEAKDQDISPKALRAVVKARTHERKAEAVRTELADIDLIDKFDLIRLSLGDLDGTPLGQHALSREPSRAQVS